MAQTYYKGLSTYAIYDVETSYGGGGTPSSSNKLGIVTSATVTVDNNQVLIGGLGHGANATNVVNGALDVTGTFEIQVNNFDVFQYVVGIRQGSGTAGDPYELAERDCIGYGADMTPSLVVEIGAEGCGGAGTDDVWKITGLVFTSAVLNFNEGEVVTATLEFIAKTFDKDTTLASTTVDTATPFVFMNLDMQRDTTAWFGCTAFTVTVNANPFTFRDLSTQDRTIKKPARGSRRYEWSMTLKKALDSSEEDYSRAMQDLMGAASAPTQTAVPTFVKLRIVGDQGIGSGAEHFDLILENSTFNNIDETIEFEDGITEVTFTGTALSGDTDGSDKVLARYYTEA